jgi:hypothetical protein
VCRLAPDVWGTRASGTGVLSSGLVEVYIYIYIYVCPYDVLVCEYPTTSEKPQFHTWVSTALYPWTIFRRGDSAGRRRWTDMRDRGLVGRELNFDERTAHPRKGFKVRYQGSIVGEQLSIQMPPSTGTARYKTSRDSTWPRREGHASQVEKPPKSCTSRTPRYT